MVTFIVAVIVGILIVHTNLPMAVRMAATETILLTHWLHESSEHMVRIIEIGHIGHATLVG